MLKTSAGASRTTTWWIGATGAAALAALVGWMLQAPGEAPSATVAAPAPPSGEGRGFSVLAAGGPPAPAAEPATGRSVREVERALLEQGSLRGTEPDGGWLLDEAGRLQPSIALRRRFDYYLSGVGEATLPELSALLATHARRDLAPGPAAEVLALWDRYLALQQYRFQHSVRMDDRATWPVALAERQQVRRQMLGVAWAAAFYADEEAELARHIAQPTAEPPAPSALLPDPGRVDAATLHRQRVEQFGEAAAQRLREEDAQWAAWERRLLQAHAEIGRLQRAPELSELQRNEAIAGYLAAHFDERERLRVRALMRLP